HGRAVAGAKTCKARPASSVPRVPAMAMSQDDPPTTANPTNDASAAPTRSADCPPSTMQAAEVTRYALTAHCTPAELRESSVCMVGNAAMIAVLLAPTASVARHDDQRTDANPDRWLGLRTTANAI